MSNLRKKFDQLILKEYDAILGEYGNNDIIERVSKNDISPNAHYLPHHAVPLKDRHCQTTCFLLRFRLSKMVIVPDI